jgi:hypothetical protein
VDRVSDAVKIIDGKAFTFEAYVEYLGPITGAFRAREVAAIEWGLGGDTIVIDEQGQELAPFTESEQPDAG